MTNKVIEIGSGIVEKVNIGKHLPLVFIGGPCAIESKSHADKMANEISEICLRLNIPWIFNL